MQRRNNTGLLIAVLAVILPISAFSGPHRNKPQAVQIYTSPVGQFGCARYLFEEGNEKALRIAGLVSSEDMHEVIEVFSRQHSFTTWSDFSRRVHLSDASGRRYLNQIRDLVERQIIPGLNIAGTIPSGKRSLLTYLLSRHDLRLMNSYFFTEKPRTKWEDLGFDSHFQSIRALDRVVVTMRLVSNFLSLSGRQQQELARHFREKMRSGSITQHSVDFLIYRLLNEGDDDQELLEYLAMYTRYEPSHVMPMIDTAIRKFDALVNGLNR